jgi:hypothetical protein
MQVSLWTFLTHLSTLPRLNTFISDIEFFDETIERPEGCKLSFPAMDYFGLGGFEGAQLFNTGLSAFNWPALRYVELPRRSWTPEALSMFLEHAPRLAYLPLTFSQIDLDEMHPIIAVLIAKSRPALKTVRIRCVDVLYKELKRVSRVHDFAQSDSDTVTALRRTCTNASIHLAVDDRSCHHYYGTQARLDSEEEEAEEDVCSDSDVPDNPHNRFFVGRSALDMLDDLLHADSDSDDSWVTE